MLSGAAPGTPARPRAAGRTPLHTRRGAARTSQRRPAGAGGRCRGGHRPSRSAEAVGESATAAAPAPDSAARHVDRGGPGDRADLPPRDRGRRVDGAVRRLPPGRCQRAPAARQVRLALADHQRGHDDKHRPRPVGAAEDRGHLEAGAWPGELRLLLHPQGVEEHRPVAVLVRQHVLRRGTRGRDREPQPRPGLVGALDGPLPAARAQPPRARQARSRRGQHGAAQAATAAVRARHHDRQHPVAADRHPAQLDLPGARLRPCLAAPVRPGGPLLPGPVHRLLQSDTRATGHCAAGEDGRVPGGADDPRQLRPANGQRLRLHAGRIHPSLGRPPASPASRRPRQGRATGLVLAWRSAGQAARARMARRSSWLSATGFPRMLLDRRAWAAMSSAWPGAMPNAPSPGMASAASVCRTHARPSSIAAPGSPVSSAAASAYRAIAGWPGPRPAARPRSPP